MKFSSYPRFAKFPQSYRPAPAPRLEINERKFLEYLDRMCKCKACAAIRELDGVGFTPALSAIVDSFDRGEWSDPLSPQMQRELFPRSE